MQKSELHTTSEKQPLRLSSDVFLKDTSIAAPIPQCFVPCKQSRCVNNWVSLNSLIQVTSFVGTQRVEGGNNKLPIKGASHQQPLSLFGVAGIGILYKNLLTQWYELMMFLNTAYNSVVDKFNMWFWSSTFFLNFIRHNMENLNVLLLKESCQYYEYSPPSLMPQVVYDLSTAANYLYLTLTFLWTH